MPLLDCCPLKSIARATAKAAQSRLRQMGVLSESHDWRARAQICERCPMRIIHRGVSHCGKPYLQQMQRDEAIEGCGCPTIAKAKDASEHCPVDARHQPARHFNGRCNCKWCAMS